MVEEAACESFEICKPCNLAGNDPHCATCGFLEHQHPNYLSVGLKEALASHKDSGEDSYPPEREELWT